jgi:hypothetical protein
MNTHSQSPPAIRSNLNTRSPMSSNSGSGSGEAKEIKAVKRNPYSSQSRRAAAPFNANKSEAKANEALKLINPEKFIQQNNFIPVPSMVTGAGKFNQFIGGRQQNGAPSNFFESGEAISQERFARRTGFNARAGLGSATAQSPFPRRTRPLDDHGELAASEEQGGSSERSGSNYRGGGVISISGDILNSIRDKNEEVDPVERPKKIKKKRNLKVSRGVSF